MKRRSFFKLFAAAPVDAFVPRAVEAAPGPVPAPARADPAVGCAFDPGCHTHSLSAPEMPTHTHTFCFRGQPCGGCFWETVPILGDYNAPASATRLNCKRFR